MKHENNGRSTPSLALVGANHKKRETPYLTIFVIILLLQQSEACKTTIQRLGSNISKLKINGNRNGNRIAGKGKYNWCYILLNNIL